MFIRNELPQIAFRARNNSRIRNLSCLGTGKVQTVERSAFSFLYSRQFCNTKTFSENILEEMLVFRRIKIWQISSFVFIYPVTGIVYRQATERKQMFLDDFSNTFLASCSLFSVSQSGRTVYFSVKSSLNKSGLKSEPLGYPRRPPRSFYSHL